MVVRHRLPPLGSSFEVDLSSAILSQERKMTLKRVGVSILEVTLVKQLIYIPLKGSNWSDSHTVGLDVCSERAGVETDI